MDCSSRETAELMSSGQPNALMSHGSSGTAKNNLRTHPLVERPLSDKVEQVVVDEREVLFGRGHDGHDDVMPDGFLRIMRAHFKIL